MWVPPLSKPQLRLHFERGRIRSRASRGWLVLAIGALERRSPALKARSAEARSPCAGHVRLLDGQAGASLERRASHGPTLSRPYHTAVDHPHKGSHIRGIVSSLGLLRSDLSGIEREKILRGTRIKNSYVDHVGRRVNTILNWNPGSCRKASLRAIGSLASCGPHHSHSASARRSLLSDLDQLL
jgi:hypothetical protein